MPGRWGADARERGPGSDASVAVERARLAVFAVFVAFGVAFGAWASVIPVFKVRLALGDTVLGMVLLGFAAGAVGSMRLAGPLAQRFGERVVTAVGALGFAVALLLPEFARSAGAMGGAAVALGAGSGVVDVAMNALASRIEQRLGRPTMSFFHAGYSGGGLGGALLGAGLAGRGPGGAAPLAVAAVLTVGAALACLRHGFDGRVESQPRAAPVAGRLSWALPALAFTGFLVEGAIGDWGGVALATLDGASARVAPFGYGVFACTMVAGRLLGGRVVLRWSRQAIIGGGGLLACAGFALLAASTATVPALIGFALTGAGLANVVPALFSAAAERGPSPAHAIGRTASAGYAGLLVGPPLIGALADLAGLRTAIGVLAGLGVLLRLLARRV